MVVVVKKGYPTLALGIAKFCLNDDGTHRASVETLICHEFLIESQNLFTAVN